MNDQSSKSDHPTLPGLSDAIGSPASVAGISLSGSPDGAAKSGQLPYPVSPSPRRVKAKVKPIRAIFGRTSSGSSRSAALQQSLENKYRPRLDLDGSMEYSMTLKRRATPAGRSFLLLAASARRTSDRDCTGWPTARGPHGCGPSDAVTRGITPEGAARLAGFNTPRATDGSNGGPNQANGALPADAALAGWATTNWHDGRRPGADIHSTQGGNLSRDSLQVLGPTTELFLVPTGATAGLDAAFSRWLQGFPEKWDETSPGFDAWLEAQVAIESGV